VAENGVLTKGVRGVLKVELTSVWPMVAANGVLTKGVRGVLKVELTSV